MIYKLSKKSSAPWSSLFTNSPFRGGKGLSSLTNYVPCAVRKLDSLFYTLPFHSRREQGGGGGFHVGVTQGLLPWRVAMLKREDGYVCAFQGGLMSLMYFFVSGR